MVMAVNTIVLTRVLHLSYTTSNGLIEILPRAAILLMLPIWARLFDRVGVLRFRVVNSACWTASLVCCGSGAMLARMVDQQAPLFAAALLTYAVGRIIDGLAQGGGAIAWNIGHLHFAEDDKAELYMGIHVSLTGLRGMVAPFIGTLLYEWVDAGVFVVAAGLAAIGGYLFWRLSREDPVAHGHL